MIINIVELVKRICKKKDQTSKEKAKISRTSQNPQNSKIDFSSDYKNDDKGKENHEKESVVNQKFKVTKLSGKDGAKDESGHPEPEEKNHQIKGKLGSQKFIRKVVMDNSEKEPKEPEPDHQVGRKGEEKGLKESDELKQKELLGKNIQAKEQKQQDLFSFAD